MKKNRFVLMLFCVMGLSLSACSTESTAELPTLTVNETIEAQTGAHSWNVKQGFGTWMCQDASSVFPLDYPDDYPSVSLSEDGVIRLAWETPPDGYTVSYWPEPVWDDGMAAAVTSAQENDQGFTMPEGDPPAIVTVQAQWERALFRGWYGTVEYIFKVTPAK